MSQRFLKVIVTKQAYTSLNELVKVLRKDPVAGKHTDLIVTNMGVTSAAFNESYFLKPLIELDAGEKVIKAVQKSLDVSLSIQNKMIKKAFSNYSGKDLLDIANIMEARLPVVDGDDYYFQIPINSSLASTSDQLVENLRKNPEKGAFNAELVKYSSEGLKAVLDYEILQPLAEMKAKFLVVKIVDWATKMWMKMNAFETKRIVSKMSSAQLVIYASLIESSLVAA